MVKNSHYKKNSEKLRDLSNLSGNGEFIVTATHTGEFWVRMEFNANGTLRVVNKNLNVDYELTSHNISLNLRLHGICNKGDILQVTYDKAKVNNSASMVILY